MNLLEGNRGSPEVSVVVPVYNSASTIDEFFRQLSTVLIEEDLDAEIIFINDGSTDTSWEVLEKLCSKNPNVVIVDMLRNRGQGVATMCGLNLASGELIATMDDDLEHRPDQLPKLIGKLRSDHSIDAVVATWPVSRSFWRDLGSRFYALSDRLSNGTPNGFRHTAFRVMRRPVRDALINIQVDFPVVGPLLRHVAANVQNVEVENGDRFSGVSNFSLRDGVRRLSRNLRFNSTAPLRLISLIGLLISMLAIFLGLTFFARWLIIDESPDGWLSLFLAVSLFSGVILLSIGTIGLFIADILREVRAIPHTAVRRIRVSPKENNGN